MLFAFTGAAIAVAGIGIYGIADKTLRENDNLRNYGLLAGLYFGASVGAYFDIYTFWNGIHPIVILFNKFHRLLLKV